MASQRSHETLSFLQLALRFFERRLGEGDDAAAGGPALAAQAQDAFDVIERKA